MQLRSKSRGGGIEEKSSMRIAQSKYSDIYWRTGKIASSYITIKADE